MNDISLGEICHHKKYHPDLTQSSDYKTSKTSFINTYNQFARFLVRSATLIMLISYAASIIIETYSQLELIEKMNPGLIEALSQVLVGLKHIGNGVSYFISFFLNALGLSASQELIKLATILILLSLVWKLGSKITSSIFWLLILSQFMSLVNPS